MMTGREDEQTSGDGYTAKNAIVQDDLRFSGVGRPERLDFGGYGGMVIRAEDGDVPCAVIRTNPQHSTPPLSTHSGMMGTGPVAYLLDSPLDSRPICYHDQGRSKISIQ